MTAEPGKRYPVSARFMRVVIGFAELRPNGRYAATYNGRCMSEEVALPGTYITFDAAVKALQAYHSKSCEAEMERREAAR